MKNNLKSLRRAMALITKANIIFMGYPDVALALHDVIRLCNEATKTYTEGDYPIEYSGAMNLMGMTYRRLSTLEDEVRNLELAISYYWRSIKIKSISEHDAASIYINIAIAYRMLSVLERNQSYLEKAKIALDKSAEIKTLEGHPYEHATTMYELGLTLICEYDFTKDKEKLVSAISHLSNANSIFQDFMGKDLGDTLSFPVQDYTFSNYFLGKAYAKLSQEKDRVENLNKSRDYLLKVLEYIPRDEYPENYADAAFELGNTLSDLYTTNGSKDDLLSAIGQYEESKSIFTLKKHPFRYASIIDEMGKAYLHLAKDSNLDTHINTAMWLFDESYNILLDLDSPVKEEVLQNYKEAKEYYDQKFKGDGLIYA